MEIQEGGRLFRHTLKFPVHGTVSQRPLPVGIASKAMDRRCGGYELEVVDCPDAASVSVAAAATNVGVGSATSLASAAADSAKPSCDGATTSLTAAAADSAKPSCDGATPATGVASGTVKRRVTRKRPACAI